MFVVYSRVSCALRSNCFSVVDDGDTDDEIQAVNLKPAPTKLSQKVVKSTPTPPVSVGDDTDEADEAEPDQRPQSLPKSSPSIAGDCSVTRSSHHV